MSMTPLPVTPPLPSSPPPSQKKTTISYFPRRGELRRFTDMSVKSRAFSRPSLIVNMPLLLCSASEDNILRKHLIDLSYLFVTSALSPALYFVGKKKF